MKLESENGRWRCVAQLGGCLITVGCPETSNFGLVRVAKHHDIHLSRNPEHDQTHLHHASTCSLST